MPRVLAPVVKQRATGAPQPPPSQPEMRGEELVNGDGRSVGAADVVAARNPAKTSNVSSEQPLREPVIGYIGGRVVRPGRRGTSRAPIRRG